MLEQTLELSDVISMRIFQTKIFEAKTTRLVQQLNVDYGLNREMKLSFIVFCHLKLLNMLG